MRPCCSQQTHNSTGQRIRQPKTCACWSGLLCFCPSLHPVQEHTCTMLGCWTHVSSNPQQCSLTQQRSMPGALSAECWHVRCLGRGRQSLRNKDQQRWDGGGDQVPNQWLRRLRKKIHPIYSLKKTAGECGLSGPGEDHVWLELQPCLQNKVIA